MPQIPTPNYADHYSRALKLFDEGKDFIPELTAHHEDALHRYQAAGFKEVQILAAPDGCAVCQKKNEHTISVTQALKTHPLPCKTCTTYSDLRIDGMGFCRCGYIPVLSE